MWKTSYIKLQDTAEHLKDRIAIVHFEHNDMRAHTHDCFELAYVTQGSALQIIDGVAETVKRGDYFFINYDSVHEYKKCQNFGLFNCLFLSEVIDDTMVECRSFDKLLRLCLIRCHSQFFEHSSVNRIFHDEDGSVLSLLSGMLTEYQQRNTGYLEILRSRLTEILVITMRKSTSSIEDNSFLFKRLDPLVLNSIHYIENHYNEKQVIGRFCEEHHYSQQYICRRFKQETGMTALEYLQKIRIKKSCELLAGSNLQVQEIARRVGYEDIKFFHTLFSRHIHMSPKEYRLHAT